LFETNVRQSISETRGKEKDEAELIGSCETFSRIPGRPIATRPSVVVGTYTGNEEKMGILVHERSVNGIESQEEQDGHNARGIKGKR